MYGDGNTSKLVKDITEATTQASSGLLDGLGINLGEMVNSFVQGKAIASGLNGSKPNVAPESEKPTQNV